MRISMAKTLAEKVKDTGKEVLGSDEQFYADWQNTTEIWIKHEKHMALSKACWTTFFALSFLGFVVVLGTPGNLDTWTGITIAVLSWATAAYWLNYGDVKRNAVEAAQMMATIRTRRNAWQNTSPEDRMADAVQAVAAFTKAASAASKGKTADEALEEDAWTEAARKLERD